MRSVVGTLAPLFLYKMIQRAFLQPAPGHIQSGQWGGWVLGYYNYNTLQLPGNLGMQSVLAPCCLASGCSCIAR